MKKCFTVLPAIITLAAASLPLFASKGVVVNLEGKPIPGAEIISIKTDWGNQKQEKKLLHSNKKGEFTYSGNYYFLARAKGYSYGQANSEWVNGKNLKITLWPEQKFYGKVVDENGKPVMDAKVYMSEMWVQKSGRTIEISSMFSPEAYDISWFHVKTNKNGEFVLDHLADGTNTDSSNIRINFSKDGLATINEYSDLKNTKKPFTVTMPSACTLQGTLYLPNGKPAGIEGELYVQLNRNDLNETRNISIDDQGRFKFIDLPPGPVNITFCNESGMQGQYSYATLVLPAVSDLELSPDKPTDLDLQLVQGTMLKVKVVDKKTGKQLKAEVNVIDASRPGDNSPFGNETEKDGIYWTYVAPGEVTVQIRAYGSGDNMTRYNNYYEADDWPSTSITIMPGQEEAEATIEIDPATYQNMDYSKATKKIPDSFKVLPGTYELTWDPELRTSFNSGFGPDEKSKAINLITAMPALVSENPKKAVFQVDGCGPTDMLAVVFDESKGTGKGYDTVYVDANRNWNLSDDAPLKLKKSSNSNCMFSTWIEIPSHQGPVTGEHTNYPIDIQVRAYYGPGYFGPELLTKGGWKGTVNSTDGKVQFAAIDANHNGIYGDETQIKKNLDFDYDFADYVFIDTNKSGSLSVSSWGNQTVILNKISAVGSRYYDIQVSQNGNKVTIAPYEGKTGKLKVVAGKVGGIQSSISDVGVVSENGYYYTDKTNQMTLPVGKYKVINTDAKPKNTKLCLSLELQPALEVNSTNPAIAKVDGKITSAIDPSVKKLQLKSGAEEKISLIYKIGNNATFTSVSNENEGSLPVEAKLCDMKGNLVKTLELGSSCCCEDESYTLIIPDVKTGNYILKMSIDTQSKLGILKAMRNVEIVANTKK